jgi:hypothetical protein
MRRRTRSAAIPGSAAPAGLAVAALVGVAGVLACVHPASTFEDDVLRKGDLRVQVGPVPASWHLVGSGGVEGADVAFRDDARSASTLVDVRCGSHDVDAPLSALTAHLIMGTTERTFETEEVVPFDHREALHTVLRAKLDGVPMQYDIYVMKKDGCVFDLVYVASPDHFAEGAPDFERFALGVHAPPAPPGADTSPGLSRGP